MRTFLWSPHFPSQRSAISRLNFHPRLVASLGETAAWHVLVPSTCRAPHARAYAVFVFLVRVRPVSRACGSQAPLKLNVSCTITSFITSNTPPHVICITGRSCVFTYPAITRVVGLGVLGQSAQLIVDSDPAHAVGVSHCTRRSVVSCTHFWHTVQWQPKVQVWVRAWV